MSKGHDGQAAGRRTSDKGARAVEPAPRRSTDCEFCGGAGTVEITIGGDGYGGRCCAQADVEAPCPNCAAREW